MIKPIYSWFWLKPKSISLLTGIALSFTSTSILAQEIPASEIETEAPPPKISFICSKKENNLATVVKTSNGDTVPLINWVSDYFSRSGYTPQKRCEIVSQRFQTFYDQGKLRYLTTGRVNGYSVICPTTKEKTSCSRHENDQVDVLITLSTSNPVEALKQLLSLRTRASNEALSETHKRIYLYIYGHIQESMMMSLGTGFETGIDPSVPNPNPDPGNTETKPPLWPMGTDQ